MCVIIDRKPGVTVPGNMLEIACDINKHGYGIAFADRGRLEIIKSSKQPNDPAEVAKRLEDLKAHRVFLHLRHATVGDVNEANQHPFVSLSAGRKDKPLVGLMHNGTIYSYSPPYAEKSTASDTLLFNEKLVKPLLARSRRAVGEKKVILDEFVKWLLGKEIGSTSKVVLFDAFGNATFFNKELGKQYEGWWASNDYSFDTTHQRSSHRPSWANPNLPGVNSRSMGSSGVGFLTNDTDWSRGDTLAGLPWEAEETGRENYLKDWEKEFVHNHGGKESGPVTKSGNVVPLIPQKTDEYNHTRVKWECEKLYNLVKAATTANHKDSIYIMSTDNTRSVITRSEKVTHTPFIKQAGIASLDMLGSLSKDDLMEMATSWPQATSELVIEFLYERLQLRSAYKLYQQKAESFEAKNRRQFEYIEELLKAYKEATGTTYSGDVSPVA